MTKPPLISVIIPAHNNEQTIRVALDSMRTQTYPNLEVIVVDDHSSDNTAQIVREYMKTWNRLSYYKLPFRDPRRVNKRGRNINAGYSARNYGFAQSKGDWITFQDGDDASLANRIEVQYELAQKYQADHVCLDWQPFDESILGKSLDAEAVLRDHPDAIVHPKEIVALAAKTKGAIIPFLGPLNRYIPFEWKRARIISKLFFGSLASYPGTGNSPLVTRAVMERVRFRPLPERVWPSFMGRGADRDFNFQVAETFKNSWTFFIPLYLWRQDAQRAEYDSYTRYLT